MTTTCDSIIADLQSKIEQGIPIGAHEFLEKAGQLNVLLGGENERLYNLESVVNQRRAELLQNINLALTSSKAEALVKAMPEYKECQIQKAKIAQVVEHIRISKLMARMANEELRGN